MSCLQTPRLYSVYSILHYFFLLLRTCHNQQMSQRVMETFLSSEGNYIITEGIAQFLLSVTTRLMSLFLFCLRDVLSCYPSPLLYQFTFAAVTNYDRSNTSQKSNTCLTELKSRYWQGCIFFSSRVKGRINFLNFPSFQKLSLFLGLLAPSSLMPAVRGSVVLSISPQPLSVTLKDLVITLVYLDNAG